jgi:hypothetical protein
MLRLREVSRAKRHFAENPESNEVTRGSKYGGVGRVEAGMSPGRMARWVPFRDRCRSQRGFKGDESVFQEPWERTDSGKIRTGPQGTPRQAAKPCGERLEVTGARNVSQSPLKVYRIVRGRSLGAIRERPKGFCVLRCAARAARSTTSTTSHGMRRASAQIGKGWPCQRSPSGFPPSRAPQPGSPAAHTLQEEPCTVLLQRTETDRASRISAAMDV